MENKSLKDNQDNKSTTKEIILELVSILLKLAGAALMIIGLLCVWANNYGLGITLALIGTALQVVAETVDPKSKSKALFEPDPAQEAASVPAPDPATTPEPAPTPAPAPVAAQPQQVTITCAQCGQPLLIPVSSGAVKITCPKCGNSFIHTN